METKTSPSPRALRRLQNAEARQRRETLARGLFAEYVDVTEALRALQGRCGCGCGAPLDFETKWDAKNPPPGYPVIAHTLARGSRGEHSRENVSVWRWACNRRAGIRETSEAASVKRFAVQKGRAKRGSIASRGFQKPTGKHRWPKRPMRRPPC